ncbi:MAG: acetyl-CoA carboxylase biotin carboxylase subunit [Clostridia bacterium]|nr:acetyl-CoA carboxylase biotin carboxylase subunit [Clostridia bacterium]
MNTVLIANRGEIAVRIIRTCKKLGLNSIAVYSEADKDAYYTRIADQAVCIGPAKAEKSYLNIDAIMTVAKVYNACAIHPGIGFLSENSDFQRACEESGIIFIGPDALSMDLLGDKAHARQLMIDNDIPVPMGSDGEINDYDEAKALADRIGYPVIIKASHGGGGGGIRIVHDPEKFKSEFMLVKKEALASFGSESVYIEQYLQKTRHIEVQILADGHGNVLHFGTRECSMQRKNQKLVEEAPAPFIPESIRHEMEMCAVKIAEIAKYKNAGTVEFLLTEDNKFYFMEMNTRIQVEHPVTEAVYGIDLIKGQIQIALNHKFALEQKDINASGHAIECRINAENPEKNFAPSPGRIKSMQLPGGFGVRVDSGYADKDKISPFYDSMILKVICHGQTRDEAIAASCQALSELDIQGVDINSDFAKTILKHEDFKTGNVHTKWIEQVLYAQVFKKA